MLLTLAKGGWKGFSNRQNYTNLLKCFLSFLRMNLKNKGWKKGDPATMSVIFTLFVLIDMFR